MQNDIHLRHQEYLHANNERRRDNDASTHHGIDLGRVADWHDKWEQLRIFHDHADS